jgi:hypothetical protein
MSQVSTRSLLAAVLASASLPILAQQGEATAPVEAASIPADPAAVPITVTGGEAGQGQVPPMPTAPMTDPGYGQVMAPPYGQMMDPGYGQMAEPSYGQAVMPGYGQGMMPGYGQMADPSYYGHGMMPGYGQPMAQEYGQMPYGYGGQQMAPGMLTQQGMPQAGQYPGMANPYKDAQRPMGQGMGPEMYTGYRAARMAERDAFHQSMLGKLDVIADRLDRIEKALQERGE